MRSWVIDTVQGSDRRRARRVSMRPSCNQSQASSEASETSAGVIARRAIATHLSACAAEYASIDVRCAGPRAERPRGRELMVRLWCATGPPA